ncbi:MAG: glycosyltransferase, partial [Microlunatus sp.]
MDDDVSEGTQKLSGDGWDDLRVPITEDEPDRWAWLREQHDEPALPDVSHCTVTAVLVTLDAEDWLPDTLAALSRLTVKPSRLIAVDNGSTDSTLELLERAHRHGVLDAVVEGPEAGGFGAGVAAALAAETPAEDDEQLQNHFLWLLHDDAVPRPDALQRLLAHLVSDPGVDITGPKLLFPRRRHRGGHQLSELGVSISGTGRRELGLDLEEIDQGQRDRSGQTLGVSTCGMLLRLSTWRDLGGLDPGVPCFRDGVELGWRATARGLRVVTTPEAAMVHRQVGRAGL